MVCTPIQFTANGTIKIIKQKKEFVQEYLYLEEIPFVEIGQNKKEENKEERGVLVIEL